MDTRGTPRYEFGPFHLDPDNRQLLREGEPVALTPKVFDALIFFVQNSGRVILKDDLLKALWPDTFVAESNLTQAVFTLRKALGETGSEQHYIETVPRRGYRFASDVKIVTDEGPASSPPAGADPPAAGPRNSGMSRRRASVVLVAAAVVIAVAVIGGLHASKAGLSNPRPRLLLAVLPFENLTGDPSQEYFSDGLTEEMIHQAGNVDPQHLSVIARTSVMRYKQSPQQWDRIRRALSVQYVLEGSVRRDGQKVRISVQLIRMTDQTHVWAREYDRELNGLLAVQAAIAQEVAREIGATLGEPGQTAASTSVYEAYDFYLKGRYFWNKRTREGFETAIDSFEQAIALDPRFARAYAGLADAYALMASYRYAREDAPKARTAALRALELDERLAEAHTSLALIIENNDWDWARAETEYRRAIQLNPNYATAHHWYAEFLAFQGRFEEALASSERARQLDPLSLMIAVDRGVILYYAREYDRAIEQFRAVMALEPDFPRTNLIIPAYAENGMFSEALEEIERRRPKQESIWTWSSEAYLYRRWGRLPEAKRALKKLEDECRRLGLDQAPFLAGPYVGIDNTKAIEYMNKLYAEHVNGLIDIKVNPALGPIRGDPRFQDLMRRMGLGG